MMRDLLSGLLALALCFGGGYWYGTHTEAEAQAIEVQRLNIEARQKEQALTAAVNTTANVLRAQNEKTNQAIRERNRAIDDGSFRLRLPVKTTCPIPAATNTAIASGDNARETRAELDAETGKTLFAIAEEGDRAIRKLNACISLYNQAIESQKGKP
jgi:hypothetical protein